MEIVGNKLKGTQFRVPATAGSKIPNIQKLVEQHHDHHAKDNTGSDDETQRTKINTQQFNLVASPTTGLNSTFDNTIITHPITVKDPEVSILSHNVVARPELAVSFQIASTFGSSIRKRDYE